MSDQLISLYEKKDVLIVSAQSKPHAVAGAVAGMMRENNYAEIRVIGAAAVNQAVKSVAIARDYLKGEMDLVIAPKFVKIYTEDGNSRNAIHMEVLRR